MSKPIASICFTVAGEPVGRPRALVGAFFNKKKGKWQGRAYHPKNIDPNSTKKSDIAWRKAIQFEQDVNVALLGKVPPEPWDGAVRVSIDIFVKRPKWLQKKSSPKGLVLCLAKPDRDNADKAVLDAMTIARVWLDDKQVCAGGHVRKFYAEMGAGPGVVVLAEHLGDPVELARAGLFAGDLAEDN